MNNLLRCPTVTIAVLIFFSFPAQTFSQVTEKDSPTFFFEIYPDTFPCWRFDSLGNQKFKIANGVGCPIALRIGSDSIHITNALMVFDCVFEKNTVVLKNPDGSARKRLGYPFGSIEIIRLDTTCSIKYAQVIPCKTEKTSANNVENLIKTANLFIPSVEQELEYQKNAAVFERTESEICCPGTQELVFDYAVQCLVPTCDLEDCVCNKCAKKSNSTCDSCKSTIKCVHQANSLRRFHPRVDEGVRVRVKGMNPYRDHLVLHVDCYDRNKEGRASFQAMLDRFAKQVDSTRTTSSSKKSDIPTAQSRANKVEQYIPAFRDEMAYFYQRQYNATQLSDGFLAQCVIHIQDSIKRHFEIPAATPELMTAKLNLWLDSTQVDKEKYRAILKDGVDYYTKIMNYRISTAWLFQVKNSDVTKLGFEWYRDGQRVSANPQSFEFFNKGGFTIDFSVGIAINGLVNHAFTSLAEVVDTAGTTKYRVIRQQGSSINIGPVLLAHAYYRYPVWNRFKIGATTGFMTNTRDNDFGLNFLFGGSLLFGSEERFNLTFGAVLGKVARLKEGLEEGVTLLDAPLANLTTDVPTRDVYRCKWFVGVTYNLGR
jgi:hypothetical protein